MRQWTDGLLDHPTSHSLPTIVGGGKQSENMTEWSGYNAVISDTANTVHGKISRPYAAVTINYVRIFRQNLHRKHTPVYHIKLEVPDMFNGRPMRRKCMHVVDMSADAPSVYDVSPETDAPPVAITTECHETVHVIKYTTIVYHPHTPCPRKKVSQNVFVISSTQLGRL